MTVPKTKQPRIRPSQPYGKMTDGEVLTVGGAAVKGMTGNAAFSVPPVSLTDLNTLLGSFKDSQAAALEGSKQAISTNRELRAAVIKDLRLLGAYVEANSNGSMSTFTSSGFQAASVTRTPAAPLSMPSIRKIDQGNSGQLLVKIVSLSGASSYEIRYAALTNGQPGAWTTVTATKAKSAVPIGGLTPTTNYAFQVRALGKLGYTDWTDSATRICI